MEGGVSTSVHSIKATALQSEIAELRREKAKLQWEFDCSMLALNIALKVISPEQCSRIRSWYEAELLMRNSDEGSAI